MQPAGSGGFFGQSGGFTAPGGFPTQTTGFSQSVGPPPPSYMQVTSGGGFPQQHPQQQSGMGFPPVSGFNQMSSVQPSGGYGQPGAAVSSGGFGAQSFGGQFGSTQPMFNNAGVSTTAAGAGNMYYGTNPVQSSANPFMVIVPFILIY